MRHNQEIIDKYRLEFCNFIDNNIDLFAMLMEEQIRCFNSYYGGSLDNHIGSHTYQSHKSDFYEALFRTYLRLRLRRDITKDAVKDGKISRRTYIYAKLNDFKDKLSAGTTQAAYRKARLIAFATAVAGYFGIKEINTWGDIDDKVGSLLEQHSGSELTQDSNDSNKLYEYFHKHKHLSLYKLENLYNVRSGVQNSTQWEG